METALPPWPRIPAPAQGAQALLGGELIMRAPLEGVSWQVGFAAPFELVIRREGKRLRRPRTRADDAVMLWAHQRCPALQGTLEGLDLLLRTTAADNDVYPRILVADVWDRQRQVLLDHRQLREACSALDGAGPQVSTLGEIRTLSELQTRVTSLAGPGARMELRREEGGVVVAWTQHVVTTARGGGTRP